MNTIVRPGHTLVANGTLTPGVTLTAEGGTSGGLGGAIKVTTNADILGSVVLEGGAPGQAGGTAEVEVHAVLVNQGSILVESGRYVEGSGSGHGAGMKVAGLVDNFGTIQVGDDGSGGGAHLNINGGGELINIGLLLINGGIYNDITGGPRNVAGSTLSVVGVLSNTGTLMARGGGNSYGADSRGADIAVSGTLINAGALVLGGGAAGSDYTFGPGYGATLSVTGQLLNQGQIEIGAAGDSSYRGTTGASGGLLTNVGVLTNDGSIVVDGSFNLYFGYPHPGTFASTGQLTNIGVITAAGGGSSVYRGGGLGGLVSIGGQSAVNDGILTAAGGVGSYVDRNAAGGTIMVTGVLASAGSLLVQGGQYGPGDPAFYITGYGGEGGALLDSGTIDNTGLLSIGAGAVDGAGTGQGLGGTASIAGTLVNYSTILVDGGSGGGTDGLLDITATGTLVEMGGTIVGGGVVTNAGLIDASAGGIGVHGMINDGTVEVAAGGSFGIAGGIAAGAGGSGHLVIGAGAELTLGGAVSADQSIGFMAGVDTLRLGDAAQFAGVLQGLSGADTIDLLGLQAMSVQASGAMLSIGLQGGEQLHLTLGAALGSDLTLRLGSDGHGGTDLLFGHG